MQKAKTIRISPKPSSFLSYFISYIALVALALGTLVPYMINSLSSIDKYTENSLQITIDQTLDNLDTMLSNVESMLISDENNAISTLSQLSDKRSSRDYYTMRKATQYLYTIVNSNPAIYDIMVANLSTGITLRAGGGFDSIEAFDRYYALDSFYNEAFLHAVPPYYLSSRSIELNVPCVSDDAFGYCFNLNRSGNIRVFILVKTQEYLGNELMKTFSGDSYAILSDARGEIIHEIGSAAGFSADAVSIESTSNSGRFVFKAYIPHAILSARSANIIMLLAMCVFVSLVISVIYAIFSARRHVRPLRQLTDELNDYNQKIHASEARIAAMQCAVNDLQEKNHQFYDQIENYRRIRHENTITRLFTSSNLSEEDLEYLNYAYGTLPRNYVVGYGKVNQSAFNGNYSEEISLILANTIRSQLPNECLLYLPDPTSVAVLIDAEMADTRAKLAELFPDINWFFSRTYCGEHFVAAALEEARVKHELNGNKLRSFSMQSIQRVYQCLIAGNTTAMAQQLDEIFGVADWENIRFIYDGLRFVIHMVANEQRNAIAIPPFSRNIPCDDLCNALRESMFALCRQINSRKKSKNEERKNQVLEYIQDNYADSSLYAPMIAEKVGISEKYLYNFVKEQTGKSLGDYLLGLRMDKAAELLKKTQMPIKDICFAVGFNSENSFYKAFKRAYGLTPTKFRASYKE